MNIYTSKKLNNIRISELKANRQMLILKFTL